MFQVDVIKRSIGRYVLIATRWFDSLDAANAYARTWQPRYGYSTHIRGRK